MTPAGDSSFAGCGGRWRVGRRSPADGREAVDVDDVAVDGARGVLLGHEQLPTAPGRSARPSSAASSGCRLSSRTACRRARRRTTPCTGRGVDSPARINGMRVPSAPVAGFALWPARSTETIVAPAGSCTFRNGCERLRICNRTSVSARPSVVTMVVAVARSATAASTPASANRFTVMAISGAAAPAGRW